MGHRLRVSRDTVMFSSRKVDIIRPEAGQYFLDALYALIRCAMLYNYL